MRQVFSSQRIETVEGVARLLTDAGIPVHISNGRSYQSKRSGQFSYTEPVKAQQQPAVWVRHAEDQPRARELLRQAGLLETTRPGQGPTLTFRSAQDTPAVPQRSWAWRVRLVLLALIALAAAIMWMRRPVPAPDAPLPPPPQTQPAPVPADEAPEEERIRIQPATGG